MDWLKALLALLGIGKGAVDIVNKNLDAKKENAVENQGEANAKAKANAETLDALRRTDRAQPDVALDDSVRARWERP
jgi:hypothetical protein